MIARALVAVALVSAPAFAETENTTLTKALRDELARAPKLTLPGVAAPYYVAYQAIDIVRTNVIATFGALSNSDTERERYLRTDLRVGDTQLDSSNFFSDTFGWGGGREIVQIDDDYHALRHEIWLATDRNYKSAVEKLEKKKAALKGQAANPDRVGDYTTAEPVQHISAKTSPAVDTKALEALVTKASGVWKAIPELHAGKATANVTTQRRTLVTTEGTTVVEPRQIIKLAMAIHMQAPDGMRIDSQYVALGASVDQLPKPDELAATAKKMSDELIARSKTASADAYTGPVLFEGPAAAQLLRALLVPELSGTPPMTGGDRFARALPKGSELGDKVGKRIVPVDFRIEDDPTIDKLGTRPLVGSYEVDDEGVKAKKVVLVEKGLLKTFLMSRTPRKGELKSNGHGRADLGNEARAQASNLIITASAGVTDAELKRRLLARARADGLTYAIVIRQLEESGVSEESRVFLFSGREESKVPRPLVAVRLGLDGKETPIRGLTFGAMPLRTLRAISAAGKEQVVVSFSGGGGRFDDSSIPASIACPALLFDDLELVKDSATQHKPPVLPRL